MKRHSTKFYLLFAAGLVTLLQACQKDHQFDSYSDRHHRSNHEFKGDHTNKFYSSSLPMGNGVIRAWVSQNALGEPVSVGVSFSEKALENLPTEPAQFVLLLPKNKGMNFYTHALVDWNPQGHEPDPLYTVPHFDFHFYIIPNEEREAIGPNDLAQFANAPDLKYIPDHYFQIPGGVPQMGAHWADLLSPEFSGSPFTKTFILGTYDGKVIFWEPMITRAYLLTQPDEFVTVRQPQAFQTDGYYATGYNIVYSEKPKEFTVSLDLEYHEGE
jgi:hypothetical protein